MEAVSGNHGGKVWMTNNMDKPKAMAGLQEEDYCYPLADVSHLSEVEKEKLRIRGMHIPKLLDSDEEFERWVSVFTPWNWHVTMPEGGFDALSEEDKQTVMLGAAYERSLWYHKKRFKAWQKEHLQPLVEDLVKEAANAPQYDWQYLYSLELKKLRCMRAYFSHSIIADKNGNFGFNRWIDICIRLLEFLEMDGNNISDDQVMRMNVRNVGGLVSLDMVEDYKSAPVSVAEDECGLDKAYYGRKIYVRKMERLYYLIRLYKMREWWE